MALERFFFHMGQKGGDLLKNPIFSLYSRKVVAADVKSVNSRLRIGQNDVPESDGNNFETIETIFQSVR